MSQFREPFPEGDPRRGFEWLDDERLEIYFPVTEGPHQYVGPPKPWCPCDINEPQHCQPEKWFDAHAPRTCESCGRPSYEHPSQ